MNPFHKTVLDARTGKIVAEGDTVTHIDAPEADWTLIELEDWGIWVMGTIKTVTGIHRVPFRIAWCDPRFKDFRQILAPS